MNRIRLLLVLSIIGPWASLTASAQTTAANTDATRGQSVLRIHDLESLSWISAAAPGLELAIVEGNPQGQGQYVVAMRYKAGTKTPPHSHPEDMSLVVLRGRFFVGAGDHADGSGSKTLDPGSVVAIPKGVHHAEGAITDSIVLIDGPGPMEIDLVSNPTGP